MKTLELTNGDKIPVIGLGTWKSAPGDVYQAVLSAIDAGYRHFDCAAAYQNESEIGKALQKAFSEGKVKRDELWITSKLWNSDHRREKVQPALQKTLSDLQLEYLDLYLVHWPIALKEGVGFPKTGDDFYPPSEVSVEETWKGMEDCLKNGLTKHIGVSNFSEGNLKALLEVADHQPEMNQVEMHPYLPQNDLFAFCEDHEILMTAYSPLGSGDRSSSMKKDDEPNLFQDPEVVKLAKKHGCTPAQILIAWAVNRDTVVIPKSTNPDRIRQNLAAGDIRLDGEDMNRIAQLEKSYRFIDGVFWTTNGSPYSLEYLWG